MKIIDLIKYALKAIASYIDLRRESFFYDITQQHLKEKEITRNEIEKLRNLRTVDSTDRADQLFATLQERERAWLNVSTAYTAISKGNTGTDNARPVPGP
jgi:hypothetical protein